MNQGQIKVTQIKSKNGRLATHKACLLGLGLKRINQSVILNDSPEVRGMIAKVSYMVKFEEF
jgi:large subunit ribosomal protein L30